MVLTSLRKRRCGVKSILPRFSTFAGGYVSIYSFILVHVCTCNCVCKNVAKAVITQLGLLLLVVLFVVVVVVVLLLLLVVVVVLVYHSDLMIPFIDQIVTLAAGAAGGVAENLGFLEMEDFQPMVNWFMLVVYPVRKPPWRSILYCPSAKRIWLAGNPPCSIYCFCSNPVSLPESE